MANSVDQDLTAPTGAVSPGSTMFASILNSSRQNVGPDLDPICLTLR